MVSVAPLRSLIKILHASLVQIYTKIGKKYANQRYAVSLHWKICRRMCVSINGPGDLDFDLLTLKLVCEMHQRWGNLHSEFEHARPLGSGVIRYVRNGRTNKSNAYCPLASLQAGHKNANRNITISATRTADCTWSVDDLHVSVVN